MALNQQTIRHLLQEFLSSKVKLVNCYKIILNWFYRYLELVRSIQRQYTLEPAGSHGVWGLDDHQFLPYVWGSAQLIGRVTLFIFPLTERERS